MISNVLRRIANALLPVCEFTRRLSKDASIQGIQKQDTSPVTVADLAVQIVVRDILERQLGAVNLVAEESADQLRTDSTGDLAKKLTNCLAAFDLETTKAALIANLDSGGYEPVGDDTYWVLDPIDGTKGFLRGDQYAIALAQVVEGQVVRGVLCCPAFPNQAGQGVIALAEKGQGAFRISEDGLRPLQANAQAHFADCVLCESVESSHSAHDWSNRFALDVGICKRPYRLDSQAKYYALSAGLSDIYLRLPTNDTYVEKVWDHAAGMLIAEESGAKVTDVYGRQLDFSIGRTLSKNRGIVVGPEKLHGAIIKSLARI